MQQDNHVFQGMRRDNHQIRQDGKFLWDALNVRLTNRDDNTLLSITNERGTYKTTVTFREHYVGHCVLGKYLVVFTANDDSSDCHIYRVEKTKDGFKNIILFHEEDTWDKAWSPYHPIEAIGVYESELIQKVYWVDGKNQPRVINIAKPELKADSEESPLYTKDSFNFVRELKLEEVVDIVKIEGLGMFSPGTIQYAFSYYDKYGQESNIFHTTPLLYISPKDRGGSPEEKISNSFEIKIANLDNFEYVRIYSIHRTSIDATPTVKVVTDIPVSSSSTISYTDTGTEGYTIEPTRLLYLGGKDIIAQCIEQKDGVLFLGGITLNENSDIFNVVWKNDYEIGNDFLLEVKNNIIPSGSSYYYNNQLQDGYSARFKARETYRCGIQAQYKDGSWSAPIYINDLVITEDNVNNKTDVVKTTAVQLLHPFIEDLKSKGYKKVRTCVVFPRTFEREVICQGVLCPTVFNFKERLHKSVYAKSSWFFRPATKITETEDVYKGSNIEFRHNKPLFSGPNRGAEIQNMLNSTEEFNSIEEDDTSSYSQYFVDENIVTFHSPDIEFDTNLQILNWDNTYLRIIGAVTLGAISGDIDILTSTPNFNRGGVGFNHSKIGFETGSDEEVNGGLVSGLFYEGATVTTNFEPTIIKSFMVYPWHRSGSVNNDSIRPSDGAKGTRSAVLKEKKISNLKFFDNTEYIKEKLYDITTPELFQSNEVSLVKLHPRFINSDISYLGNIDTMNVSSDSTDSNGKPVEGYPIYAGDSFSAYDIMELSAIKDVKDNNPIARSSEPVRIKYKSSPHLVFSLSDIHNELNPNRLTLLPRHNSLRTVKDGEGNLVDKYQYDPSPIEKPGSIEPDSILTLGGYLYSPVSLDGTPSKDMEGYCYYLEYSIWTPRPRCGWVVTKLSNGTYRWTAQKKSLIVKIEPGKTLIKSRVQDVEESDILPGTIKGDYEKKDGSNNIYVYIGKPKYYRIVVVYTSDSIIRSEIEPFNYIPVDNTNKKYNILQEGFGNADDSIQPYLLLAELCRDIGQDTKFGGKSEEALQQNLWVPSSRAISLYNPDPKYASLTTDGKINTITVPYEYGDTWYSRYDCLKTYPFTSEDENQVVEIGSFMCETRVNIDGRYDKNRGKLSNLNMTPQNFNLLNEVYSQKDTFFNYRILDKDYYKHNIFSNQITWSLVKSPGEVIDTWANITLANVLNLDGSNGKVTSIKSFNDLLVCFQDKAINQILYNSRVQIPTTDGVPIEINNSQRVDGSRVISSQIGCKNKWSINVSPLGIYFIDSNTGSLYIFNGQLNNLSDSNGLHWWSKNNSAKVWTSLMKHSSEPNGIRTFYDSKHGDVYFTPGPVYQGEASDALCYSEKLGNFTSLMSYGGTHAMFNFDNGFYSLRDSGDGVILYQNNAGKYNDFFGEIKGWNISFISNDSPTITKIFDTVELMADHYDGGDTIPRDDCPINYIQINNEYQDSGIVKVDNTNMKRKFRIWRGLLPRHKGSMQRIRNPWSMITLGWNPESTEVTEENTRNAIIHDVSVKYTI